MYKTIFIVLGVLLFASCEYLKKEETRIPIARVNDNFLYEEDLTQVLSQVTSPEDSALVVSNFINRWATQQLLIDQAKINLPESQLRQFDNLVEQYRIDLYTEAYKSSIVASQLDSTISKAELVTYYERNKENFTLNDDLLKLRYIHVGENFTELRSLEEKFKQFDLEDQEALNELSLKFISFNLNDSTWVRKDVLLKNLPILQSQDPQMLKKPNFARLQDSLGIYLLKIENVLERNDVAPLSYVEPTIRQIILNKRKQELTKKLEKDITKDAHKNKSFEIYTKQE